MSVDLETLPHLTRDVRDAAATLSVGEARVLVDLYYQLQDFRIQAGNQDKALTRSEEPHDTIGFFHGQFHQLERDIAKALDTYSHAQPLGAWARQITGVGPVISAGLLAHIDITKAPYSSALWQFAGLAPDQKYVKGEKRSWNARLKVLCWKLADSFVKQSGRESAYYGHLYLKRKEYEVARNNAVQGPFSSVADMEAPAADAVQVGDRGFYGGNAAAALKTLTEKKVQDPELKARLLSGKLPDGQLDLRARRYAVKRFLVHYWQAGWWLTYGTEPPRAYVFEKLQHVHEEPCPIPMPKVA